MLTVAFVFCDVAPRALQAQLTPSTRAELVASLWAPPPAGNGFTAGRMHLGSADFSLSTYSLNENVDNYNMSMFDAALVHDSKYTIPLAKAAQAAAGSSPGLRLFFSPWSPPAWLKVNKNMINSAHPEGLLQTAAAGAALASYFVEFTKALAAAGVPMWGATLQNEPLMNMRPNKTHYEACSYTAASQTAWLQDHLGPAVRADPETAHLKLMAYDWNKGELADWAKTVLGGGGGGGGGGGNRQMLAAGTAGPTKSYVDGFAFHWYQWAGGLQLGDLAALEAAAPGTFTLATEACLIKHGIATEHYGETHDNHGTMVGNGAPPSQNGTVAYTYASGELYALDMLGDLLFGASGWVDWNAVLDYTGGPNHVNRSDIGAPILVDAASDSYYVQSPYYYMGHLSRYVPPGSVRVSCSGEGIASAPSDFDAVKDYIKPQIQAGGAAPAGDVGLVAACFVAEDGASGTVVAMNPNDGAAGKQMTLAVLHKGAVSAHLPPHSIKTFTFNL